jgi:hypothetical protein
LVLSIADSETEPTHANGRMITRGSDDISWYSFDLPEKFESGTN